MSKNKKIISWIMLLIWMSIIFYMSHQPGDISSGQSDLVVKALNFIGIELNEYFGELTTLIVRKVAHFSEYLILFLLACNVSKIYIKNKKNMIYSIVFVFLYACTDEIHQYFIPGRSMSFKDVLIDTSGAIIGYLVIKLIKAIKIKKD